MHLADPICKGLIADPIPDSFDHQRKGKGGPLIDAPIDPAIGLHPTDGPFEPLNLKLVGKHFVAGLPEQQILCIVLFEGIEDHGRRRLEVTHRFGFTGCTRMDQPCDAGDVSKPSARQFRGV